jgi:hypothetical protein
MAIPKENNELHLNTNFDDPEVRKQLGQMITRLFELWNLDTATQLNLLGRSETSRKGLSDIKQGILSNQRDSLDRIGWLLAIHKSLRILYPENPELRYDWINRRNKMLDNNTPVEIMKKEGIIGLAKISNYLDFLCGQ